MKKWYASILITLLIITATVWASEVYVGQEHHFVTDKDSDIEVNFVGTGTHGQMNWRGGEGESYFEYEDAVKLTGGLTGNIGIGTSSPQAPLHIDGTSSEQFLVTTDEDGADVFKVDTTNQRIVSKGMEVYEVESIANGTITSSANWVFDGTECVYASNQIDCSYVGGTGTITQPSASLAVAPVASKEYRLQYEVISASNDPVLSLTEGGGAGGMSATATNLPVGVGTHYIDFISHATPDDFLITVTLDNSEGTDDISLDNIVVRRLGMKIDGRVIIQEDSEEAFVIRNSGDTRDVFVVNTNDDTSLTGATASTVVINSGTTGYGFEVLKNMILTGDSLGNQKGSQVNYTVQHLADSVSDTVNWNGYLLNWVYNNYSRSAAQQDYTFTGNIRLYSANTTINSPFTGAHFDEADTLFNFYSGYVFVAPVFTGAGTAGGAKTTIKIDDLKGVELDMALNASGCDAEMTCTLGTATGVYVTGIDDTDTTTAGIGVHVDGGTDQTGERIGYLYDGNETEAVLIRKNSDGGDIVAVDTVNGHAVLGSTGNVGCIIFRDTDNAGWTEVRFLNGAIDANIDSDGICNGS